MKDLQKKAIEYAESVISAEASASSFRNVEIQSIAKDFTAGYTKRNDEVVKDIEEMIADYEGRRQAASDYQDIAGREKCDLVITEFTELLNKYK